MQRHEGQRDLLELTVPSKSRGGGVGALALSLLRAEHAVTSKQSACPAIIGVSEASLKPLVPRISV
ncbi:hypothetical protein J6590_007507 [Homalodisca vitripennis]|nr:hypothetical protein J6590_007507 [Homalodisca vitripennis]